MPRTTLILLAAAALVVGCTAQGHPLREHAAPYAYSPSGAPVAAPGAGGGLPPGEQPATPPMMGGGGMMDAMMATRPQHQAKPSAPPPRRALAQAFAGAGLPGPGFDPFSFVANSMRYGPGAAFGFPAPPANIVNAADLAEAGGGAGGPASAPASAPAGAPTAAAPAPTVVPLGSAPAPAPASSEPTVVPI